MKKEQTDKLLTRLRALAKAANTNEFQTILTNKQNSKQNRLSGRLITVVIKKHLLL